jgi:hypothetical protein
MLIQVWIDQKFVAILHNQCGDLVNFLSKKNMTLLWTRKTH